MIGRAWRPSVTDEGGPLHKRRNVTGHLPEPYRESVDRKMANAYAMSSCADALHRELLELNPSAARSLRKR